MSTYTTNMMEDGGVKEIPQLLAFVVHFTFHNRARIKVNQSIEKKAFLQIENEMNNNKHFLFSLFTDFHVCDKLQLLVENKPHHINI